MMKRSAEVSISEIVGCVLNGGVVVLPTDTVYGMAALPTSQRSIDRVYELKRRPRHMNLPIMVASERELADLGLAVTATALRLLRSPLIPGSITLAMGFNGTSMPAWLKGRDEVAVRIPNDQRLLAVLRDTGPLLVTSANIHGAETCDNMTDVLDQLDGSPDLAIDGGILHTVPSTLINCRLDPPIIEREGAIKAAQVMEFLK